MRLQPVHGSNRATVTLQDARVPLRAGRQSIDCIRMAPSPFVEDLGPQAQRLGIPGILLQDVFRIGKKHLK